MVDKYVSRGKESSHRKEDNIDLNDYVQDVVVIHMSKRKDRYRSFKKESKRIKLTDGTLFDKIRIHEAVDGRKIKKKRRKDFNPEYTFQSWYDINPEPRFKNIKDKDNTMVMSSDPEIGISLSHMGVLKDIIKKKTPYTLILEDDFTIDEEFQNKLKESWDELPKDFDLFYLSYLECSDGFKFDFYKNNLLKIHNGLWWLSGYILSYEGAKKLIDNFPVVGVVDMWINHIIPSMNVYATKTLLIDQRNDMKSDNIYSFTSEETNPGYHSYNYVNDVFSDIGGFNTRKTESFDDNNDYAGVTTGEWVCDSLPNELNSTTNSTVFSSDESGQLKDNLTGSKVPTYITEVGLYDEQNLLVGYARLSKPIPKSTKIPMRFNVRMDY